MIRSSLLRWARNGSSGRALNPDILAGRLIYQRRRWIDALRAFSSLAPQLPDELTTLMTFLVPPADGDKGDRALMFLGGAWAGTDRAAGQVVLDRVQAACPPDIAVLDPTRWITFESRRST
jgi:hypothetical protein